MSTKRKATATPKPMMMNPEDLGFHQVKETEKALLFRHILFNSDHSDRQGHEVWAEVWIAKSLLRNRKDGHVEAPIWTFGQGKTSYRKPAEAKPEATA